MLISKILFNYKHCSLAETQSLNEVQQDNRGEALFKHHVAKVVGKVREFRAIWKPRNNASLGNFDVL